MYLCLFSDFAQRPGEGALTSLIGPPQLLGQMDGRTDKLIDGWTDGRTEKWMVG